MRCEYGVKFFWHSKKPETTSDPVERQRLMTIVCVGGGPTGVELAGAFAETRSKCSSREFRRIDPSRTRVILIEGSNVI